MPINENKSRSLAGASEELTIVKRNGGFSIVTLYHTIDLGLVISTDYRTAALSRSKSEMFILLYKVPGKLHSLHCTQALAGSLRRNVTCSGSVQHLATRITEEHGASRTPGCLRTLVFIRWKSVDSWAI